MYEAAKPIIELNFENLQYKFNKEDYYRLIELEMQSKCNENWKATSNKTDLTKIKTKLSHQNPALNLNRNDQVLITRLRIGPTKLTYQDLLCKEN